MLWIGPPPTHSNAPPPDELEQMTAIARKYDVAERDARNRALGCAGEERVLAHERASLPTALIGPVPGGCAVGDLLQVIFQPTPPPGRIICVHIGTGATVGAIGGIPGLSKVIECLQAGVQYEAHVDNITGGRVDLTVNLV